MRDRLAFLLAALAMQAGMEAAVAAPIRILAFGDSLTEGFTAGGVRMYPYANKLDELFKKDRIDVEVGGARFRA
jgi:hypothetical protein